MTRMILISLFLLSNLALVPAAVRQNSAGPGNQTVQSAFETMRKLSSYKARADLAVGSRRARIDAEVGIGKVAISMLGFDGKRSRNIVSDQESFISTDEGKSWHRDADKYGLVRYNFIGEIFDPSLKLHERGEWQI